MTSRGSEIVMGQTNRSLAFSGVKQNIQGFRFSTEEVILGCRKFDNTTIAWKSIDLKERTSINSFCDLQFALFSSCCEL